jgi:hypothetical protein
VVLLSRGHRAVNTAQGVVLVVVLALKVPPWSPWLSVVERAGGHHHAIAGDKTELFRGPVLKVESLEVISQSQLLHTLKYHNRSY